MSKTLVQLILNSTRPHVITYTYLIWLVVHIQEPQLWPIVLSDHPGLPVICFILLAWWSELRFKTYLAISGGKHSNWHSSTTFQTLRRILNQTRKSNWTLNRVIFSPVNDTELSSYQESSVPNLNITTIAMQFRSRHPHNFPLSRGISWNARLK